MNSDTDSDSGSERERSSDPNEELLSSDDKTCDDEDAADGDSDDSAAALAERQQLLGSSSEGQRRVAGGAAAAAAGEAEEAIAMPQQIDVVATVAIVAAAPVAAVAEREPLVASVRESVECFYSAQDLLDYGHMLSSTAAEQRTPDVESGYFDKSESDDVSREEFELVSSTAAASAALHPRLETEQATILPAPNSEQCLRLELSRFCSSMEAFERQQVEQEMEHELLVVAARQHCTETVETEAVEPQSEPYLMQVYRLGKWRELEKGQYRVVGRGS